MCIATDLPYPLSTAEEQDEKLQTREKKISGTRLSSTTATRTALETNIEKSVRVPRNHTFPPHKSFVGNKAGKLKLVALACSTGGPKSLQQVIPKLPAELDAPVVIVQHMPKGFTNSLAVRLNEMSKLQVKEAENGELLKKGCVYIAPGGKQTRIEKTGANYKIVTTDEPERDGLRPCANIMYESLRESSFDEITCVVLTGMGADGTMGIGALAEKNNIYVISQDKESCVVYGMPRAVYEAKLSDEVQPLEKIAEAVTKNVGVLNHGR
jgi:two-component system chemotaxis response regulator CheB